MVSKENKPDKKSPSKQKNVDEKSKVDNWYVDPKREPEVADRKEMNSQNQAYSTAHPQSNEDDESLEEAEQTNLYEGEFFNAQGRNGMSRHHKDGHTS